ncbi:MAG: hypothetical protein M1829_000455 [Trizodia sp. TS-e1964]|nr:MAG: hypothetical protein M1829_000455 [Trizodia sp. TS-e1964]
MAGFKSAFPLPGKNGVLAKSQESQQKIMSERRKTAATAHAEMFINGPAKELMKKDQRGSILKCNSELLAILRQAFEAAGLVWRQPTALECVYLEGFDGHEFSSKSPYMEAHPLHRMEEDDTTLNRHALRILVTPLVLGYGDSFGENYGKSRAWAKAVVWLDE